MHNFRKLCLLLKKAYPAFSVTVRRVEQEEYGCAGRYAAPYENCFWITIRRDLNDSDACHALIHEFAHIPSYDEWERTGEEHNPVWAYHHGLCYQIFQANCT